jgi:uncharacterized protein
MTKSFVRYLRITTFILIAFFTPSFLFSAIPQAEPNGYVNDFAGVLTLEQKNSLENKLAVFSESTTNEISVVTVKNLDGDYIEHYAEELFKAWGIGTRKNDNGVLLLIAVDNHKMRIEVGYGLEGVLTDAISAQIIENDLAPAFKRKEYYGGIDQATDDIIRVTKGEYVNTSSSTNSTSSDSNKVTTFLMFILAIGTGIITFIISIFARSRSWWAGGIFGAFIGGLLTIFGVFGITFIVGSILTIILALLGFLFDYIVSSRYSGAVGSGSKIPWWIGGGNSGGGISASSSGGSSFGGFSGGSSGGGGASGNW